MSHRVLRACLSIVVAAGAWSATALFPVAADEPPAKTDAGNDAASAFGMTRLWTVHLMIPSESWKTMTPARGGFPMFGPPPGGRPGAGPRPGQPPRPGIPPPGDRAPPVDAPRRGGDRRPGM